MVIRMNKKKMILSYLILGMIEFIIILSIIIIYFALQKNNTYNVVFSENGNIIKNIKIKKNSKIKIPKGLDKDGYEIHYYFNDEEYNFDDKVTGNIVIEIEYVEKETVIDLEKYTVTFNTNGGSTIESVSVDENSKVTKPKDPTKDNYKFIEWQLDGKTFDFDSVVTENIELVAIWEENKPQDNPTPEPTPNPTPEPAPNPTPTPAPEPTPQPVIKNYSIGVSQVDAYSPDCYLTVYENGAPISVIGIAYDNGENISASINGASITVSKVDIEGETSFIITLNDYSTVVAYMQ